MVSLSNQEGPAFDFGELQEAIVLQGVKFRNDEATKARMLLLPLLSLSLFSPLVTFDKNKHFPLKAKGLTISNRVMILLQYTWMLWSSKLGNFFTDSATAQRDLKKKKKVILKKSFFLFPFLFDLILWDFTFVVILLTALFTAAAGGRPAATLEMFPSWPMRFQQTPRVVCFLYIFSFDHFFSFLV